MRLTLETSLSPGRRSYARLEGNIYQQQQTTREHITVHCCVNAAGDNIPPFIIYPGCHPSNAYRLDRPPSMASRRRVTWTQELLLKLLWHLIWYAPEERPLTLIMDQHETHVSKDVIMYCRDNFPLSRGAVATTQVILTLIQ